MENTTLLPLVAVCLSLCSCGPFTLSREAPTSTSNQREPAGAGGDDVVVLQHAVNAFSLGAAIAELVPSHSHDARVVNYAREVGRFSSGHYRDGMELARSHGVDSPVLSSQDTAQIEATNKLYGKAFDRRYLQMQKDCLQTILQRLQASLQATLAADTHDFVAQSMQQIADLLSLTLQVTEQTGNSA